ncbi:MAG TPA: hypothetical protein VFW66_13260 [Gemmatimonadales bacterium]|nr:hypothetical protein [Gemmatimonadales bacterium]
MYDSPDDEESERLVNQLNAAGLTDIARALVQYDKTWWLGGVEHKVYIEPEASMVSGEGWSLYHEDPGWFDHLMAQLRTAGKIASQQ